jgi:hypothetical protein
MVTLYDGSRNRLMVFLPHNMMILRRFAFMISGVSPTPSPAKIAQVRLPY